MPTFLTKKFLNSFVSLAEKGDLKLSKNGMIFTTPFFIRKLSYKEAPQRCSGRRELAFFRSWIRENEKKNRSWIRENDFVRDSWKDKKFVKIEKLVREFVNFCAFGIFGSWIDTIAFLNSWKPPFLHRSWTREN